MAHDIAYSPIAADPLLLEALLNKLDRLRNEAIARFRENLRPETLLVALRRSADQVLRELIRHCPLPRGAAMAAVGGYGHGELFPHSDIDVLILLKQAPSPKDKVLLETLVAALWDLGLDLGHSVRTIEDCQIEAANRSEEHTSELQSLMR